MNSRLVAANVMIKVLSGRSLTVALDDAWHQVDDMKDRAFIQALCYGAIRHYDRLEFILNQLVHKPIKDKLVKALALLGLYQLQYMRVKQHAAVSETVAVMKKKQWAKSLLNALLRRYLREQKALETLADKHVAYDHPNWIIERVKADWQADAKTIFAENNLAPPMVLRVNKKFCSREDYLTLLLLSKIKAVLLDSSSEAILLSTPVMVDKLPKFSDGWVSIQDSAAQLAAPLLAVEAHHRVADICAAPGGKTAHILELTNGMPNVYAIDIDERRLARVAKNLNRLQLHAELCVADATQPDKWWDGQLFDRILLDAPCSALGVIRRHPDIKRLRRAEDIDVLQQLQRHILDASWRMLKSGGILLYVTCSILKQENELQIEVFLSTHADAKELPINADWGIKRPFGRQILTGMQAMDGFYYARLQKN